MGAKAIVIGAGIAGIAAAIRLRAKGYEVEVFDKNPYTGGKLTEIQLGAYRFDAGPSLFTSPEWVMELFTLMGEEGKMHMPYERLNTLCHYFFADGTFLRADAKPEIFAKEVEEKLGVAANKILDYLKKSAWVFDTTEPVFLTQSLHRWQNFMNHKTLLGVLRMPWLGIFGNLNRHHELFFNHPKLVQLFNRYATYNGSNPYECPAVMQAIPHLEYNQGAYFPKQGMHAISQSLTQLAKRHGVQFHLGRGVDEILLDAAGRVSGVRAHGATHHAQVVISNMDAWYTYRQLLPKLKAPEQTLNQPRSSSALIFYWGISQSFPQLDVHNIFFSADYRQEFDAIFKQATVSHDPTVYINITSKRKPDDAPEYGENWFVMVNVPPDQGQDWDKIILETRTAVLNKLSKHLKVDLASLIEAEDFLHPRLIDQRTFSYQGSLYGTSSNNRSAAFLRHPNFSKRIPNLYFCGGSVHPGGGIPLCLRSAKIAVDEIPSLT